MVPAPRWPDWRVVACWLLLAAITLTLITDWTSLPVSFLWIPVLVAATFASPTATGALAGGSLVGAIAVGLDDAGSGDPQFWVRTVAWTAVSTVGVLVARRRVERETRLAELATHDPLTGLANRRLLTDRLDAQLSVRGRTAEAAVLFADLDGFKAINDTHGHGVGDEVLVKVAERLRACARSEDTISRVGGDEFVVASPDIAGLAGVAALCQRIHEALETPVVTSAGPVRVGITIGAVMTGAGAVPDVAHLVDAADQVLIALKETEPGGYRVIDATPPPGKAFRPRSVGEAG